MNTLTVSLCYAVCKRLILGGVPSHTHFDSYVNIAALSDIVWSVIRCMWVWSQAHGLWRR